MSGFDSKTGWCHFTPKKRKRYYREIECVPSDIEERFLEKQIPFYWDSHGGIHAKCTDGEMWTILSGEASTFSSVMPCPEALKPEFLTVTDIGINVQSGISAIKVNKVLSLLGFQTKENGSWKATQKGLPFSIELEGTRSKSGTQTYLKWKFKMIELLSE